MKTPKELADEDFERYRGQNVVFWSISDSDPEVQYWKEIWLRGFNAAKDQQKEIDNFTESNKSAWNSGK